MRASSEDVAANLSGNIGAEWEEESVELLVCECYVEEKEKEEAVTKEDDFVTKEEEFVTKKEVDTKEEDGDDTQSLDNETGSCRLQLVAGMRACLIKTTASTKCPCLNHFMN